MVKKAVRKGIIFIVILLFIIAIITPIFIIKIDHRSKLIQGLYDHTGKSFDVVLMGSSHMEGAVDPNILWSQYGITSFNYATGGQPIDVTYYLLKEMLKNHDKPLVVMDLYYLGLTNQYGQEGYIRYVLDNMKFSANKAEAIVNCTPMDQWINYFFPIFKYHDRWKELNEQDFHYDVTSSYIFKGYDAGTNIYGKDSMSDTSTTEVGDIPAKSKEYLDKIIDLSKKEGFKLVFINAPHDYTSTVSDSGWYKDPAKMFNEVAEIAKENNIPFINYNNKMSDINFDFKSDMNNVGHVNVWGSNKISADIGKFLKDNYNLTDHRGDKNYAQWDTESNYYYHTKAGEILRSESNIKDYASLLANKDYVVSISSNDYSDLNNDSTLKDALKQLGLKVEEKNNANNYIAVVNDNKVQTESSSSEAQSYKFNIDSDTEVKMTTASTDKNIPSTTVKDTEYSNNYAGTTIVVYDKVVKQVVDSITIEGNNTIKRKD